MGTKTMRRKMVVVIVTWNDDDDDACQAFQSHNPLTARATIGATFAVLRLRLHLV